MKLTSNLSLKKPDGSDVVNIDDFNANADIIDKEVQDLKTGKANSSHTHAMGDVGIITSSAVNSTSTTTIANSYAVKQAYDKGNAAAVQAETNKTNIANQGKEIENLKLNVNNGKTVLATAIGAPLASTDTFSQMSAKVDTFTNTFRNALANIGVETSANDKVVSLINKVDNMSQYSKIKYIPIYKDKVTPKNSTELFYMAGESASINLFEKDGYLYTLATRIIKYGKQNEKIWENVTKPWGNYELHKSKDFLYITTYNSRKELLQIDTNSGTTLKTITHANEVSSFKIYGNYIYVATGYDSNYYIYDLNLNLILNRKLDLRMDILAISDEYIYASSGDKLHLLDLQFNIIKTVSLYSAYYRASIRYGLLDYDNNLILSVGSVMSGDNTSKLFRYNLKAEQLLSQLDTGESTQFSIYKDSCDNIVFKTKGGKVRKVSNQLSDFYMDISYGTPSCSTVYTNDNNLIYYTDSNKVYRLDDGMTVQKSIIIGGN